MAEDSGHGWRRNILPHTVPGASQLQAAAQAWERVVRLTDPYVARAKIDGCTPCVLAVSGRAGVRRRLNGQLSARSDLNAVGAVDLRANRYRGRRGDHLRVGKGNRDVGCAVRPGVIHIHVWV